MSEERPPHQRSVVYTIPNMHQVARQRDLIYKTVADEELLFDVYLPPNLQENSSLPGVIFIHGGPVSPEQNMKEEGQYLSWGALAAASGLVGITFNHRYYAPELLDQSVEDVTAAVDHIRANASAFQLDPDRLCLWVCSGGGPHICFALRERPSYVRCMVIYYAIMNIVPIELLANALDEEARYYHSPINYIQDMSIRFPIFVARAGLDYPEFNQTMDDFITQAIASHVDLEVMNHAHGHHAFDMNDDDSRSKQIIMRTLAFIKENT